MKTRLNHPPCSPLNPPIKELLRRSFADMHRPIKVTFTDSPISTSGAGPRECDLEIRIPKVQSHKERERLYNTAKNIAATFSSLATCGPFKAHMVPKRIRRTATVNIRGVSGIIPGHC